MCTFYAPKSVLRYPSGQVCLIADPSVKGPKNEVFLYGDVGELRIEARGGALGVALLVEALPPPPKALWTFDPADNSS